MGAAVLLTAWLTLFGCAADTQNPALDQQVVGPGAGGQIDEISVLNVTLLPPTQGDRQYHPAGSDVGVQAWISNESSLESDTLLSITTPAAESVQIDGDRTVPPGTLADFATEDGTEVTLINLTRDVYYGQPISMTFSFAQAGSLTLNVPVEVRQQLDSDSRTPDPVPEQPGGIRETNQQEPTGS